MYTQKVHFMVYIEFTAHLNRSVKVGDPLNNITQMGALNSKAHYDKVKSFVELAQAEGATIHCGETVDSLSLPADNAKVLYKKKTYPLII